MCSETRGQQLRTALDPAAPPPVRVGVRVGVVLPRVLRGRARVKRREGLVVWEVLGRGQTGAGLEEHPGSDRALGQAGDG